MGLSAEQLAEGIDAIAAREPAIATALARTGYPEPRIRETGYRTLLRTIVGQQVSVAAASRKWRKLEAALGEDMPAEALLAAEFDELRACGLSRQKQGYARSLCELVVSGELDLDALPADDEEHRPARGSGIGRWSADSPVLRRAARHLARRRPRRTGGHRRIPAPPSGRARRPRARWPRTGARIAARSRS